jgi:hypothetical protein
MKKFLSGLRGKTLLIIFTTTAALMQTSCRPRINKGGGPPTNHVSNWINWNYIFKDGTDSAARRLTIENVVAAVSSVRSGPVDTSKQRPVATYNNGQIVIHPLTSYLSGYLRGVIRAKKGFFLDSVQVHFCSCHDTLLWNLTGNLNIGGSGQSAPVSPPPPGPGASGDAVSTVDSNGATARSQLPPPLLDSKRVDFGGSPVIVKNMVLGIIDTGIDSTLFSPGIYSQLFAADGSGTVNFIPGLPSASYKDDDPVRHGSAVAAIALSAFYGESGKAGQYKLPRLMALKALDSTGRGSTFSVSCALSYAISHKVNLINLSLGYPRAQDQVIDHFLQLSAHRGIPVIAAAGNTPGEHEKSLCDTHVNWHHELGHGHLFFPACQSIDQNYCIISVTGLSNPDLPCRYQNFSSRYIGIGVVNKSSPNSCCGFSPAFVSSGYTLDGSSFATPVISGQLGFKLISSGPRSDAASYIQLLQPLNSSHTFLTWRGEYINY